MEFTKYLYKKWREREREKNMEHLIKSILLEKDSSYVKAHNIYQD